MPKISIKANRSLSCLPTVARHVIAAHEVFAKGRFSPTLFLFLQKHYTSSSGSAWALTSYLESVDTPQRGQSRVATAKPPATSMRSPMSVLGR